MNLKEDIYQPGDRIRKRGGGEKRISDTDKTLLEDLDKILFPKGDPMTYLLYTSKSVAKIQHPLHEMGHAIVGTTVRRLLLSLHYSQ